MFLSIIYFLENCSLFLLVPFAYIGVLLVRREGKLNCYWLKGFFDLPEMKSSPPDRWGNLLFFYNMRLGLDNVWQWFRGCNGEEPERRGYEGKDLFFSAKDSTYCMEHFFFANKHCLIVELIFSTHDQNHLNGLLFWTTSSDKCGSDTVTWKYIEKVIDSFQFLCKLQWLLNMQTCCRPSHCMHVNFLSSQNILVENMACTCIKTQSTVLKGAHVSKWKATEGAYQCYQIWRKIQCGQQKIQDFKNLKEAPNLELVTHYKISIPQWK